MKSRDCRSLVTVLLTLLSQTLNSQYKPQKATLLPAFDNLEENCSRWPVRETYLTSERDFKDNKSCCDDHKRFTIVTITLLHRRTKRWKILIKKHRIFISLVSAVVPVWQLVVVSCAVFPLQIQEMELEFAMESTIGKSFDEFQANQLSDALRN